ncbi:MAG: S8 family serine peptidase [Candidatus Marinimicrobia bacterium]|jgi:subtilisin family serine protease|nr:S8 family serine peptidase [Candidatus Neomarinimicrobiota bacterium]MBT3632394.1 S8 family serine peptidase [Candidatus Neomarinimicrobiota bacterium]MBT3825842.1 S8 family serine peptidase [Candidatus Neomarinimicrobiota bacterium]MBT4129928.1 S8 family serine peptidase [Candidatus Neomarinimicrobiota bacterium]MBT4294223.1 S8 family serine peptidase [Candidatus Neomarinimicrobiota bacterium]
MLDMTYLQKTILFSVLLVNLVYGGAARFVENDLLVRFDEGIMQADIEIILMDDNLEIVRQVSRPLNLWLLRVDLDKNQLSKARRRIENIPEIKYAQNNHYLSLRNTPDDPLYLRQWNFHNTGFDVNGNPSGTEDADIDAPEAWEISTGGETVFGRKIVAAIVDGGCDLDHIDLQANLWSNPLDTLGNLIDDDGNGWVDDSLGWNAYGHNGDIPQTNLDASHGTHVAGTVGAHSNNANQVAGVNWDIQLMIVAGASTTTDIAMEAYSYVLEQKLAWLNSGGLEGAFVVTANSSFGENYVFCDSMNYPVWNDMYNSMGEAGILSIAATANVSVNVDVSGDLPTSCSSPYLITVTNTNRDDVKANSAGYGEISIDLAAPGYGVLSTNYNQGTSTKYGTSMSAPHVTGAVALMHAAASSELAQYYEDSPASASRAFKSLLLSSVDPLASLDGVTVTGGRLNLHHAVLAASIWPAGSGDLNQDFIVDIQDLVILVNLILGNIPSTPELVAVADLNYDTQVTVQDLVRLINTILQ